MSDGARDCGVCGVPATVENRVTEDGYTVPRCSAHARKPAYQAESRLRAVEEERDELFRAHQELAADHYFRRAEKAEAERDQEREKVGAVLEVMAPFSEPSAPVADAAKIRVWVANLRESVGGEA